MKIRYLRGARRNIADIADYIAEQNPSAAERVANRIQQVVALLALRPGMGMSGLFPGTREFKIPGLPYQIIYRVSAKTGTDESLDILRVHHVRRRPPSADW